MTDISKAEAIDEVSKWGVGLGILIFALAPLSLPLIVLTIVALIPLLIPVLVLGLLALPVLAIRRIAGRPKRATTPAMDHLATPSRPGAA